MRVTKEPEVRRQEILDAALRLFGEKGYERTSIADIAKAVGVAQGLCYRYFPSKEALFDCAVDEYAGLLAGQLRDAAADGRHTLRELIERMPASVEAPESKYYLAFHGAENRKFHAQLALKVCEKLVPPVTKLLCEARQRGEIDLDDPQTAALFAVYGQLGLLLAEGIGEEERQRRIRSFLLHALRL